jgi:ABC-type bacteriocin/lantibiotic exporter with double-glycine peptidase domain
VVRSFLRYGAFFYSHLGYRLFLVWGCLLLASVLESIGIVAILPIVTKFLIADSSVPDVVQSSEMMSSLFIDFIDGFSIEILLIMLLGVFFIKALLILGALTVASYSRAVFFERLKNSIFDKIVGTDYAFYSGMAVGRYLTLINEQVSITLVAFKQYLLLLGQCVTAVVYIMASAMIDPIIVLIGVGIGVFINFCLRPASRWVHEYSVSTADSTGVLGGFLAEILPGLGYLKATNQIDPAHDIVKKRIRSLRQYIFRTGFLLSASSSVREPVVVLGVFGLMWYELSANNGIRGEFLAVLFLMYRSLSAVMNIQSRLQGFLSNAGAVDCVVREQSQLDSHQASMGLSGTLPALKDLSPVPRGLIASIRGVDVELRGRMIFSCLDLDLMRGEFIAIVGRSGSGKTTLLNLLLGLVKPSAGNIRYFDENDFPVDLDTWRSKIGYCPQVGIIFDGTVASNILLTGPGDIDARGLEKAKFWASKVGLFQKEVGKNLINLDTQVGQGGLKLSGGQRQRLCIARELAKEPQVLILDEPTSALDANSRSEIARLVAEVSQNTTVIIITHNIDEWSGVTRVFNIGSGNFNQ